MKIYLCFCFFLLCFVNSQAQKKTSISFKVNIYNEALVLDKKHTINGCETSISKCKFYISQLVFLKKGKVVFTEKDSYHLIDVENKTSSEITLNLKNKIVFDEISFVLGIDSSTNHSGVKGGSLDPSNGMYWTWQSGYVNFKLEGNLATCESSEKDFIFHLGGFLNGTKCDQKINLAVENQEKINLDLDLSSFLEYIYFKKTIHIMTPGEESISLSKRLAKCFSIQKNEE